MRVGWPVLDNKLTSNIGVVFIKGSSSFFAINKFSGGRHPCHSVLMTRCQSEFSEEYEEHILLEVEDNPECCVRKLGAMHLQKKASVWNKYKNNILMFKFKFQFYPNILFCT